MHYLRTHKILNSGHLPLDSILHPWSWIGLFPKLVKMNREIVGNKIVSLFQEMVSQRMQNYLQLDLAQIQTCNFRVLCQMTYNQMKKDANVFDKYFYFRYCKYLRFE